jgi:hypothetical protein
MHVIDNPVLRLADEVWIITALLHREHPDRDDFSVEEIRARAHDEHATENLRPGFNVHVIEHCVANRAPNSGRYRMLIETARGRRRLFRTGDPYHPAREGSKIMPEPEELPTQYRYLLDWYCDEYNAKRANSIENDPILRLRGSGKEIWANEHADEYIRRLREGWE